MLSLHIVWDMPDDKCAPNRPPYLNSNLLKPLHAPHRRRWRGYLHDLCVVRQSHPNDIMLVSFAGHQYHSKHGRSHDQALIR